MDSQQCQDLSRRVTLQVLKVWWWKYFSYERKRKQVSYWGCSWEGICKLGLSSSSNPVDRIRYTHQQMQKCPTQELRRKKKISKPFGEPVEKKQNKKHTTNSIEFLYRKAGAWRLGQLYNPRKKMAVFSKCKMHMWCFQSIHRLTDMAVNLPTGKKGRWCTTQGRTFPR